ncbi:TonB-dependent receptor plug domain-containing protein [Bradyrhizobium sp. USDA 3364]
MAAAGRASAQTPQQLNPVTVTPPTPRPSAEQRGSESCGPAKRVRRAARQPAPAPKPVPGPAPLAATAATPLNSNVIAGSTSLLGLTVHETPVTVEVVSQQQMQEQDTAPRPRPRGGRLACCRAMPPAPPAGFSMRGFTGSEITTLYNGIWIGPQDITSRVMDTASLEQVEFVKGPNSITSGLATIGGSVNYVSKQLTTGPIRSELDGSIDTLGT